jgi:hypothetical protein
MPRSWLRDDLIDRSAVPDDIGHNENPDERDDRNLQDLLQELRVAAGGPRRPDTRSSVPAQPVGVEARTDQEGRTSAAKRSP